MKRLQGHFRAIKASRPGLNWGDSCEETRCSYRKVGGIEVRVEHRPAHEARRYVYVGDVLIGILDRPFSDNHFWTAVTVDGERYPEVSFDSEAYCLRFLVSRKKVKDGTEDVP